MGRITVKALKSALFLVQLVEKLPLAWVLPTLTRLQESMMYFNI